MTAIERTAYPRFKQSLTQDELDEFYTPTAEEIAFAASITLEESYALYPVIFLKAFQKLGYLPQLGQIPEQIKAHIAQYWPHNIISRNSGAKDSLKRFSRLNSSHNLLPISIYMCSKAS